MSIYMVQQVFARPDWEEEWNAWYAGNLKVLMSVPGFRTGQRFKSVEGVPPRYMAMYTVDSPDVFETQIYKDSGGGGTASQRFRPAYQVWIRNLFEGVTVAPAVQEGQCLLMLDADASNVQLAGVPLAMMPCTGFHKTTSWRGLGIVDEARMQSLPKTDGLTIYRPITSQLGSLY